MLSLELVAMLGIAYAALVYVVVRTQLARSEVQAEAQLEKQVLSPTGQGQ
jgi:Na+-translocating ferredoxin:NAD+ oxidoreductase RnfG subunit